MLNEPTALIKKVPEPDYPWDRQADESPQAFEAFATYRDMAYQRSLAAAGWKLHKSKKLLERWSAAHGWVKRVAAWDAYNDRESHNELEQEPAARGHSRLNLCRRSQSGSVFFSFLAALRLQDAAAWRP